MPAPSTVVFVHGWSVRNTATYGKLPERLVAEAARRGWTLDARHVFLGKYVSFRDEVTIDDIARGFENAVRTELADVLQRGERFACITHSTGGPVVRHWWHRYYIRPEEPCPMSHVVMLAPANFGSALAQLGKSRLGRLDAWFHGVEPGQGVLDWLELGSPESWDLNRAWMRLKKDFAITNGVYPFVLTGQTIDRALYDHVNSYTGEPGSDGVVRAAAANLNATYMRIVQRVDENLGSEFVVDDVTTSPDTAFKIVPGRAHSGEQIGIMRSVGDNSQEHPTVAATLRCLEVETPEAYTSLSDAFAAENDVTQAQERVDVVSQLGFEATYIIDRFSMAVFLVRDDLGNAIGDYDLKLTAVQAGAREGALASADVLPKGFLQDRQRNRRRRGALTFYVNQDLMTGCEEVRHPRTHAILRPAQPGIRALGVQLEPHLNKGFAHFVAGELDADKTTIKRVLQPNQTTLVEIVMKRVVHEGVMRLDRLDRRKDTSFANSPPGGPIQDQER